MEPLRYEYDAQVRVQLSKQEIKLLREVCERHYDSAVRALSEPGKGAVLNGADNTCVGELGEATFTYRQLDTLVKGLEGPQNDKEMELYTHFRRLLLVLREESKRVNDPETCRISKQMWLEQLEKKGWPR